MLFKAVSKDGIVSFHSTGGSEYANTFSRFQRGRFRWKASRAFYDETMGRVRAKVVKNYGAILEKPQLPALAVIRTAPHRFELVGSNNDFVGLSTKHSYYLHDRKQWKSPIPDCYYRMHFMAHGYEMEIVDGGT